MAEFEDVLVRLTAAVTTREPELPRSVRLCDSYRELAGAEGAAITVRYDDPARVTLCATDERSARLELETYQALSGEGPCVECLRLGAATGFDVSDVRDAWPPLADLMEGGGYGYVLATPLRWRGALLGGLNLFWSTPPGDLRETEHEAKIYSDQLRALQAQRRRGLLTRMALVEGDHPEDIAVRMHRDRVDHGVRYDVLGGLDEDRPSGRPGRGHHTHLDLPRCRRAVAGALTEHVLQILVQFLANVVGVALVGEGAMLDDSTEEGPRGSRAKVHQATGMVGGADEDRPGRRLGPAPRARLRTADHPLRPRVRHRRAARQISHPVNR